MHILVHVAIKRIISTFPHELAILNPLIKDFNTFEKLRYEAQQKELCGICRTALLLFMSKRIVYSVLSFSLRTRAFYTYFVHTSPYLCHVQTFLSPSQPKEAPN